MTTTDHPDYATCTGCTQSKGVKKNGRIKVHNHTNGYGSWQMTVECPGSDQPYAEANREQWDARNGRWQEMPIEIAAILHEGEKERPMLVEAHSFPDAKAGHKLFLDQGMSLHLWRITEGDYAVRYADKYRVELHHANGTVAKTEEVYDDGHLNGLALRWMEQLAKDTVTAGGAR